MSADSEASERRPDVVLVRHGETAWTISGQHTGRTDIPLTDVGRHQAEQLAYRLGARDFALVLTSPRQRAAETCRLAGFGDAAEACDDVVEWDYGTYEGRTTAEIRSGEPGWSLWRDGAPQGEVAAQVAARADRAIVRILREGGDSVVFSHGHFLRVLAARWVGLDASAGRVFSLGPASISTLGWEREQPVVSLWNDVLP